MSTFNASTKQVLARLGLENSKTLFRRRTDSNDPRTESMIKFLEPGIHFRRKAPGSSHLVWDEEATVSAWESALKIAEAQ